MKKSAIIIIAFLMTAFASITAFAGTINTITISFNESREEPGIIREAEPVCNSRDCAIVDWTCSSDYSTWNPGNKVTFTVTVEPLNGNTFSRSSTNVRVNGNNTELAAKDIKSSSAVLHVNYWPSLTLAAPTNLYFEDWDGFVATWDKVEYCRKYEVQIIYYDNDRERSKTTTVDTNRIDLSSYATGSDVTFKVRAIASNDKQKKYVASSEWVSSNDSTAPAYDNTSIGNFSGSGERMFFNDVSGNRAIGWQKLNGVWYYFEPTGRDHFAYVNRWANIGGKWYFFNEAGVMVTGWIISGNHWYYLSPENGSMCTGWIQPQPNAWYYLEPVGNAQYPIGAMWANATTPDGFKVDASGRWIH